MKGTIKIIMKRIHCHRYGLWDNITTFCFTLGSNIKGAVFAAIKSSNLMILQVGRINKSLHKQRLTRLGFSNPICYYAKKKKKFLHRLTVLCGISSSDSSHPFKVHNDSFCPLSTVLRTSLDKTGSQQLSTLRFLHLKLFSPFTSILFHYMPPFVRRKQFFFLVFHHCP